MIEEKSDVIKIFEEISQIPRPSGHEEKIADFLLNKAESMGLEAKKDEFGNVICEIPASPGYENRPLVILQAHMDMVCVSDNEEEYNMLQDPIKLLYEEDWIKADSTSLGADDGIGIAMIFSYVKNIDKHPHLRLLFTVEEETGMYGAMNISPKYLEGDYLINLDSEEEGYVTSGCAGGCEGEFSYKIIRAEKESNKECKFAEVNLSGLKGGHSGMQILEVNSNAIKLMAEFLRKVDSKVKINLYSFSSGSKHNAIPNQAKALISYVEEEEGALIEAMNSVRDAMMDSLIKTDPDTTFNWDNIAEINDKPIEGSYMQKLLSLIEMLPHGVFAMRPNVNGVETSNNLAILRTYKDEVKFVISVRSGSKLGFKELKERISSICGLFSVAGSFENEYPIWEIKERSELRDMFMKIFYNLERRSAEVLDIHAGLECAFFAEKNPNLDMISFGPDVEGAHTTLERLNIPSTDRSYNILVNLLEEISLKEI